MGTEAVSLLIPLPDSGTYSTVSSAVAATVTLPASESFPRRHTYPWVSSMRSMSGWASGTITSAVSSLAKRFAKTRRTMPCLSLLRSIFTSNLP